MEESANRHELKYVDKSIILLGTAHVSRKSTELVETVIEEEKPDSVCVELCQSRFQSLTQKKKWQETDLVKIIKEKKAFFLLANFMLASIQKQLAMKMGIKPGEEMLQAIRSADVSGAKLQLADRDIRITLSRVWRTMKLWDKLKLIFQFVASLGGMDDITEEDSESR